MNNKQNLIITVGTSRILSEVVQNLLFKHDYGWYSGGKTIISPPSEAYTVLGAIDGVITHGRASDYTGYRTGKKFDAATQFGELVKALETPATIEVKLNSEYTAVVGKTHTQVGAVRVANKTILEVAEAIKGK